MDNQQPSISAFELGWFCGIIDGEGCIGLWSRGGKRSSEYKPGVRMSNTSKDIIDAYCSVLDRLGVGYHVTYYDRGGNRKEYWNVSVEGFKRLSKLLPYIKDALVCKRKQATLVWEWCESRTSKQFKMSYTERELAIPTLVAALNFRGAQE